MLGIYIAKNAQPCFRSARKGDALLGYVKDGYKEAGTSINIFLKPPSDLFIFVFFSSFFIEL
jgi:hypothetical protein